MLYVGFLSETSGSQPSANCGDHNQLESSIGEHCEDRAVPTEIYYDSCACARDQTLSAATIVDFSLLILNAKKAKSNNKKTITLQTIRKH
eukprot:6477231-Amphidinium_carterae.1